MNKKLIRRIATVVMACASVSVFAYVGCNKPNEHEHTADSTWHIDDQKHWHECTAGDNEKLDEAEHDYTDAQDTTCNTCNYERTVTPVGGEGNTESGEGNTGSGEGNIESGEGNTGSGEGNTESGTENPSVDYTTGIHTLTFAGDADIFTSLMANATSDSGYQETYFKVVTGDYLYANMKLQKNKVIKVSGKAITSNKTTAGKNTTLGISLKQGSTGAVSGLPQSFTFDQADGEKAFSFECTVTTEGEIVLAFTRITGTTGCEITELKIEIADNEEVATVSRSGVVTVKKAGTERNAFRYNRKHRYGECNHPSIDGVG